MWSALLITVIAAAAPLQVDEGTGSGLVSNAVTIEGTGSLEVKADTCNLTFTIFALDEDSEAALAGLVQARSSFASAIRRAAGTAAECEFGLPRVALWTTEEGRRVQSFQEATVRAKDFPRDKEEVKGFVAKIAAAVAETGVLVEGVEQPYVVFEVARPEVLEERLAAMAVEDAKKRGAIAGKLLARNLRYVRSAYFPAGVMINGEFHPFTQVSDPVTSDTVDVLITYTIRVAFALEQ